MARRYSGKKGKSGSKKPIKKSIPSWMSYSAKEVEMLVVKQAKEGKSPSQIGLVLRDAYGIPSVKILTKKTILEILGEKHLSPKIPEDLMALIKSNIALRKHMEGNKQDKVALRGFQLAESKIKRMVKYYKNTSKLPEDWKYDPDRVKLLIE